MSGSGSLIEAVSYGVYEYFQLKYSEPCISCKKAVNLQVL